VSPERLSALIAELVAQHQPAVMPKRHDKPGNKTGDRPPTIYVVDDDRDVRETLRKPVGAERIPGRGLRWRAGVFSMLSNPTSPVASFSMLGCPERAGIDVLNQLRACGSKLPAIMITGQGDIATAVQAMKAGAADFIEKPFGDGELLTVIERTLDHAPGSLEYSEWRAEVARRMMGLTNRQREILNLIIAGHPNKEIAARLGINQRTVESHRAIIMKRRVQSLSLIWSDYRSRGRDLNPTCFLVSASSSSSMTKVVEVHAEALSNGGGCPQPQFPQAHHAERHIDRARALAWRRYRSYPGQPLERVAHGSDPLDAAQMAADAGISDSENKLAKPARRGMSQASLYTK